MKQILLKILVSLLTLYVTVHSSQVFIENEHGSDKIEDSILGSTFLSDGVWWKGEETKSWNISTKKSKSI